MVILSLFIWPISLGLYKKIFFFSLNKYTALPIALGFSTIFILTIIIGFSSGTAAILCGLLGAIITFIFRRRAAIVVAFFTALVAFSLPFGFYVFQSPISQINSLLDIPASAEHRIGIWKFTSDKIIEHPLIGWGMNASKNIPGGKAFLFSEDGNQMGRALPLHPHNVILQIWLELGLPGILLFVGLCIFIIMTSVNRSRMRFESAMILGLFITILGISNVSFGMWQAWWIATIWLSVSFMLLVISSDKDT
jgi:O-antigen ligase